MSRGWKNGNRKETKKKQYRIVANLYPQWKKHVQRVENLFLFPSERNRPTKTAFNKNDALYRPLKTNNSINCRSINNEGLFSILSIRHKIKVTREIVTRTTKENPCKF